MGPKSSGSRSRGDDHTVLVNRAPVLTLWAAVVAEREGYDRDTALTLGRALAGLNAQTKGRRLGIYGAPAVSERGGRRAEAPPKTVTLLGRAIPVVKTPEGLRAAANGRPQDPDSVKRYLEEKFGDALRDVQAAMRELAKAYPPKQLEEIAFSLYERFRPTVPEGTKGWGAKGRLDVDRIRALAQGNK